MRHEITIETKPESSATLVLLSIAVELHARGLALLSMTLEPTPPSAHFRLTVAGSGEGGLAPNLRFLREVASVSVRGLPEAVEREVPVITD